MKCKMNEMSYTRPSGKWTSGDRRADFSFPGPALKTDNEVEEVDSVDAPH